MATTCGNGDCGRKVRKGLGRRAVVLDGGVLKQAIVCPRCFSGSVALVAPPPVTIPRPCKGCTSGLGEYCAGCVERLGGNVRELAASNAALRVGAFGAGLLGATAAAKGEG